MIRFVIPTEAQRQMIRRCIVHKIPMVEKFEYPEGIKTSVGFMTLTHEKRGNFHYLNGKRVARNFVLAAAHHNLIG